MSGKKFHVELYRGKGKKKLWYWRFFYAGEVIAKSGEGYVQTSINAAVRRLQNRIHTYKYYSYKGKDSKWYWNLKANNGQIVACCASGEKDKTSDTNMWRFIDNIPKAPWVKIHARNKVEHIK